MNQVSQFTVNQKSSAINHYPNSYISCINRNQLNQSTNEVNQNYLDNDQQNQQSIKTDKINKNTLTPQPNYNKSITNKETQLPSTISQYKQSNYKCGLCSQYLSSLSQYKKRQIILEYQIQTLKQKIQKINRQNEHLKKQQYNNHKINIQKYNPSMYFKQDLQAQLQQIKYLLELHLLSKSNQFHTTKSNQFHTTKSNQFHTTKSNQFHKTNDTTNKNTNNITYKPLSISESKKQRQYLDMMNKPIDYKKKSQQLLLQNIKLQQKLMIRQKTIQQRQLFPLYHYDDRILTLRKNIEFWFRKSQQQSKILHTLVNQLKIKFKQIKKQTKTIIQQERLYWQNQINHLINFINNNHLIQSNTSQFKSDHNPPITNNYHSTNTHSQFHINQNPNNSSSNCTKIKTYQNNQQNKLYQSENHNILIQNDHTILSLCNKIKSKSQINTKNKQIHHTKQIPSKQTNSSKQIKRKSINPPNPSCIFCQSCLIDQKNKSKFQNKSTKYMNKSNKNSAKNQQRTVKNQNSNKNQLKNISDKYQKNEETKRRGKSKQNSNINGSMIGKNFENIEIKIKQKEKSQINENKKCMNGSPKLPVNRISCQRCAQRIM